MELRHGLTDERARGQVGASADGTGLYEFNRHANARQLEPLRQAATAEEVLAAVRAGADPETLPGRPASPTRSTSDR